MVNNIAPWLEYLLDDHCIVTRWSEEDGEYLATFTEPELKKFSGLGQTSQDAYRELCNAYKVWVATVIQERMSLNG